MLPGVHPDDPEAMREWLRGATPDANVAAVPSDVTEWLMEQATPEDLRVLRALIDRLLGAT
jgi:hypothetical protein